MPEQTSVYIVEHPHHICTIHFFDDEKLAEHLEWVGKSCIWSEFLGTATYPIQDATLKDLVSRCSRRMVAVDAPYNDDLIPMDYAEHVLASANNGVGPQAGKNSPAMYYRFEGDKVDLVTPHFEWDREPREVEAVCVHLSTWGGPLCYVEICDGDCKVGMREWAEKLGETQAELDDDDNLLIPLHEVNRLVSLSSRPAIRFSEFMPPTYIFRDWLETEVGKCKQPKGAYKKLIIQCKACGGDFEFNCPIEFYEATVATAEGEPVELAGTCPDCRKDDRFLAMLDKQDIPTLGRDCTWKLV